MRRRGSVSGDEEAEAEVGAVADSELHALGGGLIQSKRLGGREVSILAQSDSLAAEGGDHSARGE